MVTRVILVIFQICWILFNIAPSNQMIGQPRGADPSLMGPPLRPPGAPPIQMGDPRMGGYNPGFGPQNIIRCEDILEIFLPCGPNCQQKCMDLVEKSTCKRKRECVRGCFCRTGYLRNDENKCVLPENCFINRAKIPKAALCTLTEVFDECDGNCQKTCSNLNTELNCPEKCQSGCLCKEGLVRNEQGKCIPPQFCRSALPAPQSCNNTLEEFHYCKAACQQTCDNYGQELDCEEECQPGCVCKEGLVRDEDGNCISPIYCKNLPSVEVTCTGPHEYVDCGYPCDTTCSHLGEPCKKFTYACVKRCYCDEGYARDHRNVCVPIKKCPLSSRTTLEFFLTYIRN